MVHTNNLGFVIATDYEKNMTESRREHGTVKVVEREWRSVDG